MQNTRKVWHESDETDTNETNEVNEFTDTEPKRYVESALESAMETHERVCGAHSESAVEQRHGKHVKATKEHT